MPDILCIPCREQPSDASRPAPKKKPRGRGHILGIPCSFGELLDEHADSAGVFSASAVSKSIGGKPARPSDLLEIGFV